MEEIKSSSSFVSGTTSKSKFEVESFLREKDDIKSRFESSSDDDSESSEDSDEGTDLKGKLAFLK